jgi:hypothetical protein
MRNTLVVNFSLIKIIICFLLAVIGLTGHAQDESLKKVNVFKGAATVTNNGISLLPTFTLGKPAAIFDMAVGRKLTFEPQLRFALEGKPWSFIFWWRYKLLKSDRFLITIGAHPSVVFRTLPLTINGVTSETLEGNRYFAEEISPNYFISKNISIGLYYLHSNGFAESATKTTHFLTINSNFSNIAPTQHYVLKLNPQFFYLKMDTQDGYYFTSTFTILRKDFPLSIQSIINKAIQTTIPGKDFIWNVSLVYSFGKEYVQK